MGSMLSTYNDFLDKSNWSMITGSWLEEGNLVRKI